jgi:hypothetical protein
MYNMMQNYRVGSFELCLFKCVTGHLISKLGTQTQLSLKTYLYQIYYFFHKFGSVNSCYFLSFRAKNDWCQSKN